MTLSVSPVPCPLSDCGPLSECLVDMGLNTPATLMVVDARVLVLGCGIVSIVRIVGIVRIVSSCSHTNIMHSEVWFSE